MDWIDPDLLRYCWKLCLDDGDTEDEAVEAIAGYFNVTSDDVRQAVREL